FACPGGIVLIALRSNASRNSIGRSDSAVTGARRNAAAIRTKMHSVNVIARIMARALKLRNTPLVPPLLAACHRPAVWQRPRGCAEGEERQGDPRLPERAVKRSR